jgi:hypothetical protein
VNALNEGNAAGRGLGTDSGIHPRVLDVDRAVDLLWFKGYMGETRGVNRNLWPEIRGESRLPSFTGEDETDPRGKAEPTRPEIEEAPYPEALPSMVLVSMGMGIDYGIR